MNKSKLHRTGIQRKISFLIFALVITFSCNKKDAQKAEITEVERINDTTYLVKAITDSFLIKGYYRSPVIPDSFNFSNEKMLYIFEEKGNLLKKEFYSKEDTTCTLVEDYETGIKNVVKYLYFYSKEKGGVVRKVLFSHSGNGEMFFREEYDKNGKIIETATDFYMEVVRKEESKDSLCIIIRQPGSEILNCSFQVLC